MLLLRVTASAELTDAVVDQLVENPSVSAITVVRGAAVRPVGDLVTAELPREAANGIVAGLRALGVHLEGSLHLEPVQTWVSRSGFDAEQRTPGSSADAVVWAEVTHRAYEESELNWAYLSFMAMATLMAGIAIVLDSQILLIGAMVLGPEFVAVAALGLGLVRGRHALCLRAARTLVLGFAAAIGVTALAALAARGLGWITLEDVTGPRPGTAFIYTPDLWSFVVALIAGAAGVLSLTSARVGGLSGVFISVTTVPAAGNVALGIAFGIAHEVWGSTLQLVVNLLGMAVAGWLTLAVQQSLWAPLSHRRARLTGQLPGRRVGRPAPRPPSAG